MRIQKSIVETLAYHDIFDYPLTAEEITKFLTQKASLKQVETSLKVQNPKIEGKKQYFCLKKRGKIVSIRITRKKFSIQKAKRAQFYKNVLKFIPSVRLVAITGALAVDNSTRNDDIDLLIITSKHTLWTTRLLANLLLWPWKRSPNSPNQSGKACINIFLDESDLRIKDKNLYTAHEIAQMRVLYDALGTYAKFVKANEWVFHFLPNWEPPVIKKNKIRASSNLLILLTMLEPIAKQTQLKYMKSKRTTEQIGKTQLLFHPKKTQETILALHAKKVKKLQV